MSVETYYLRKFGTVVQIDLALAAKSKKTHPSPYSSNHEPHGVDILPADLEVHDVEDFEVFLLIFIHLKPNWKSNINY